MHAHIIHAHSEADSFVAAMRTVVQTRLIASGATVSESDLYAMNFNPVLSPADFAARRNESHLTYALEQRHGYETGSLSQDILAEIEKVLAADLLVFTFPVFWFSVPAILKGWIDRVFISGPFYGGRRIYGAGGLAGKRAVAAFSLGGRDHMFGPGSVHGDLETGMLRHFLQGSLGYVGLQVTEPFVAYHAPYLPEEERTRMLDALATYIDSLDEQPIMAMPDLGAFDASLAPRVARTGD